MNIRFAEASDWESVYTINSRSLGYDYPPGKTREKVEAILSSPYAWIFVLETGDRVKGYIHVADYQCTYSDPLMNILALAVDTDMQGKGAGRALIERAEAFAREKGYAGIRLVSGENREGAHKFYAAVGYSVRKMQKNFIKYF